MRNSTALGLLALGLLAGPMAAHAIKNGDMDGDGHPYVGLMIAKIDGQPVWRCSGTLISPTLFLTAGHCTYGATSVEVWFDPDMQTDSAAKGYPFTGEASGTPYTHPQYNDNAFSLYDLGIVVLDQRVDMSEYGALPSLDQLDRLKTRRGQQDVTFTAVGYGLQQSFPDAAAWKQSNVKVRMVATPQLLQINGGIVGYGSLLLSNSANTGGTCFGDSGGPNFIDGSNVIAGVTSFALNGICAGTGGVYRVDRDDDLNWLKNFMP
jgi:secreted trypsin-like serine protease